jgi:hypothetical protein
LHFALWSTPCILYAAYGVHLTFHILLCGVHPCILYAALWSTPFAFRILNYEAHPCTINMLHYDVYPWFCTLNYSVHNLRICALHVVYNLRTLSPQRIMITS